MPNPCYYHPQAEAVGACIQCGMPGCADCLEAVGERMSCRRCAGALKSKLAAQTAAAPQARPPMGAYPNVNPNNMNPNAGLNYASVPSDFVDTTPLPKITPDKLLIGIGVAGAVSVLGSLGIEKILFYSHFGFPFLYLILGATVSGCLRACTGRGGAAMALTAAAVMAAGLGISHLVYAQDVLSRARALGDAGAGMTFADVFPLAMGSLSFIHWLMVAAGVVMAGVIANRESKPGF